MTVSGRAIRLDRANIDTDLIIPSSYLKGLGRDGLAEGAFAALRQSPGNPFDDPATASAPIMVAGPNFGCGSSREHAVWAIQQLGIQAVLAASFAPIFETNALRNGLVAARLSADEIEALFQLPQDCALTVDVPGEAVVLPDGRQFAFALDPFRKHCLIEGVDGIDLGLAKRHAIEAFENRAAAEHPWEQHLPWATTEDDS